MGDVLLAVLAGLLVAAIVGGTKWLASAEHRTRVRRVICHHDWFSPNDELNEPGSGIVFLTPVSEECRKCGKTR
jgi:hypothetical protein